MLGKSPVHGPQPKISSHGGGGDRQPCSNTSWWQPAWHTVSGIGSGSGKTANPDRISMPVRSEYHRHHNPTQAPHGADAWQERRDGRDGDFPLAPTPLRRAARASGLVAMRGVSPWLFEAPHGAWAAARGVRCRCQACRVAACCRFAPGACWLLPAAGGRRAPAGREARAHAAAARRHRLPLAAGGGGWVARRASRSAVWGR